MSKKKAVKKAVKKVKAAGLSKKHAGAMKQLKKLLLAEPEAPFFFCLINEKEDAFHSVADTDLKHLELMVANMNYIGVKLRLQKEGYL